MGAVRRRGDVVLRLRIQRGEGIVSRRNKWLWFKPTLAGTEWRVYLTLREDLLEGAWGQTDPNLCEIYIRATMPESLIKVTLLHELLHGLLSTPGEITLMARIFGCKEKEVDAREEEFVTHIAPKLLDALVMNFSFKFPRVPRLACRRSA